MLNNDGISFSVWSISTDHTLRKLLIGILRMNVLLNPYPSDTNLDLYGKYLLRV